MDSIHNEMMRPLRNKKTTSPVEIELVKKQMKPLIDSLQRCTSTYFDERKTSDWLIELSRFTVAQVEAAVEEAKTLPRMPTLGQFMQFIPQKKTEDGNAEFRKGVEQAKQRAMGIARVRNTVSDEVWEMLLATFRKRFIELTGTSSVEGFPFGSYTENYLFNCFIRGGSTPAGALKILERDME